jgi:hypothetical protein
VASLDLRTEEVWVRLTRSERVLAVERDVAVPYPSVIDVDVSSQEDVERGWIRVGTNWPGRYHAGKFRNRGEPWALWLAGNTERVLVMWLRDHRFGQIVLQLEDPDGSAEQLRARL